MKGECAKCVTDLEEVKAKAEAQKRKKEVEAQKRKKTKVVSSDASKRQEKRLWNHCCRYYPLSNEH